MYCTNCGKQIDDKAIVCPNCGVATSNFVAPNTVKVQQPVEEESKVNAFGIVAFAVGMASLIGLGVIFCISSIVGLIFSIIAIRGKAKYNRCNGFATAGLVLSIVSLVLWFIYWIFIISLSVTACVYPPYYY